jgi:regulator of protease activity HflC (stomatin/prohibitin superfamily)
MKLGLKLALGIAVAIIAMVIGNFALGLLNEPSDIAVAIGTIILLGLLVGAFALGGYIIKKYNRTTTPPNKEGQKEEGSMNNAVRSILVLVAVAFMAVGTTGCSKLVEPGHVGIKVNKTGSDRGVSSYPIVTGRVFYNPITTSVLSYPTFVQTVSWTKDITEGDPLNEEISFNSKESLTIMADISVSYALDPAKVPDFYVKFRSDELKNFTGGFLRNATRDAFNEIASKLPVEELLGEKKEELRAAVEAKLNKQMAPIGVRIEQFGFIGALRPPQNVIEAINAKIAATQAAMQAENELRRAEAEAAKNVATAEGNAKAKIAMAEGESKANQIMANSISESLIRWRTLEITDKAVAKWDGKRPMVEGTGSGLLLSVPVPTQK